MADEESTAAEAARWSWEYASAPGRADFKSKISNLRLPEGEF
jgi:hypothetical protein